MAPHFLIFRHCSDFVSLQFGHLTQQFTKNQAQQFSTQLAISLQYFIWIVSHRLISDWGQISLGCPSKRHPFKPFISKIQSIHFLLNINFPNSLAMWSISNTLAIVPNVRSVIGNNHTYIFNNGHMLAITQACWEQNKSVLKQTINKSKCSKSSTNFTIYHQS